MDQLPADSRQNPPPAQANDIPRRLGDVLLLFGIIALALVALGRILLHIFSSALFADFVDDAGTSTVKIVERSFHASGLSLVCVVLVTCAGLVACRARYVKFALLAAALLALFDVLPLYVLDSEVLDWMSIFF